MFVLLLLLQGLPGSQPPHHCPHTLVQEPRSQHTSHPSAHQLGSTAALQHPSDLYYSRSSRCTQHAAALSIRAETCVASGVCMLQTCRVLHVDPAYTGPVEAGSAVQPFKTFVKAWMSLGKGMLTAGVTINIRPVRMHAQASPCECSTARAGLPGSARSLDRLLTDGGLQLRTFSRLASSPTQWHQQACRAQHGY